MRGIAGSKMRALSECNPRAFRQRPVWHSARGEEGPAALTILRDSFDHDRILIKDISVQ